MSTATHPNHCYLAADVVLLAVHDGQAHVLLVRRPDDSDAYPGCWALPGGYVERHETTLQAAIRELAEETNIRIAEERLVRVGLYDAPDRDPRDRIVSHAYTAVLPRPIHPQHGDDAADAHWLPVLHVLARNELAFDHADILRDALRRVGHRLDGSGA